MAKQPEALRRYWASKGRKSASSRSSSRTKALTVVKHHHHGLKKKTHTKRRRGGGGGDSLTSTLVKVVLGGAALGYVTSDKGAADSIRGKVRTFLVDTVPGGKTFGAAATGGVALLAIDRWLYRSKWVRIAGLIGIGIGAMKLGDQGTDFKWLGDTSGGEDGDYVSDVE